MTSPVDATTTAAWADLHTLKDALVPDLRAWFAADPRRAEELTFDLADLRVDLSKNLITDDVVHTMQELIPLAPLHNPAGIEGIRAARSLLPDVPHVGIFDADPVAEPTPAIPSANA